MGKSMDVTPFSPFDHLVEKFVTTGGVTFPRGFDLPHLLEDFKNRHDPQIQVTAHPGDSVGLANAVALFRIIFESAATAARSLGVRTKGPPTAFGRLVRAMGLCAGWDRGIGTVPRHGPGFAIGNSAEFQHRKRSLTRCRHLAILPFQR